MVDGRWLISISLSFSTSHKIPNLPTPLTIYHLISQSTNSSHHLTISQTHYSPVYSSEISPTHLRGKYRWDGRWDGMVDGRSLLFYLMTTICLTIYHHQWSVSPTYHVINDLSHQLTMSSMICLTTYHVMINFKSGFMPVSLAIGCLTSSFVDLIVRWDEMVNGRLWDGSWDEMVDKS